MFPGKKAGKILQEEILDAMEGGKHNIHMF
jgi:hypothetical protein